MSDYGKTWEEIRSIREEIKELVPTANTNTFNQASDSLESFKAYLDCLMIRWEALEATLKDSK